ncbi:hypothetical protein AAFN83_21730 [Gorillibacterium sp. CAU 1737]
MDYRLVHPKALIGWIPHPNYPEDLLLELPSVMKKAVPAMVIGMDEGDDDGKDAGIAARITFMVFNPGTYLAPGQLSTDGKGYQDLLNLMHICRSELAKSYLIGDGKTAAQKPFRWGVYQKQAADYWIGWLTFRATAVVLPLMTKENLNF